MSPVMRSRTLSVSIDCPPDRVYDFVSNPENIPRWATAFARSIKRAGAEWIVETTDGPMEIRFVRWNEFGVLDHTVKLASGVEILNPMRVVSNGTGSEVLFTLFQPRDMSDQKWTEDAGMVERDLRTLKSLLEPNLFGSGA
jgi:Polyketide cyclase / dehydrase and lipid transport